MWRQILHLCLFVAWFGRFAVTAKKERISYLTFNTALQDSSIANDPAIPNNREDRLIALIDYLKKSKARFVCLQEVSYGQDVERIVTEVSKRYPHSLSELHDQNGVLPPQFSTVWEPPCDPTGYGALYSCAINNSCWNIPGTPQFTPSVYSCLKSNCAEEFYTLIDTSGEKCLLCLTTNSPASNYTRCTGSPSTTMWNMNKLGLLLLSKTALTDTSAVEFFPNQIDFFTRGYLRAKAGDKLTVGCVHVTTTAYKNPPLNDKFTTYEDQNKAEIQQLVDTYKDVKPFVMAGDYNVGVAPKKFPINSIGKDAYNILTTAFTRKMVTEATFAGDNPYNTGTATPDIATAHVFINGDKKDKISKPKVVLKASDVSVGPQSIPLSSCYGVEALAVMKM